MVRCMKGTFKLLGCNPFIYHQTLVKFISSKSFFRLCLGNKEHRLLLGEEVVWTWLQGQEAVMRKSLPAPGHLGGLWSRWSPSTVLWSLWGRHWAFSRHVAWDLIFICVWNRGVISWNQKNEGSFKMYTFSKFNIINAYCNVGNIKNNNHLLLQCTFLFIIEKNIILLTYCKCTQNQRVHSDIKNVYNFY